MTDLLVEVSAFALDVPVRGERRRLLDGVDFSLRRNEVLGLVGESGSGKSTTARALIGAIPPGAVTTGTVAFAGRDVLTLSPREMRGLRSREIVMIGQNPRSAMNPVRTVGDFAIEALVTNLRLSRSQAHGKISELLREVGIDAPDHVLRQYPHQLSGGMLQRVVIAAALAVEPALIVADEPTSALDTLSQADVIAILNRARKQHDISMLFITHDLDLASRVCDRTAVMYAGRVVESQPSRALLTSPRHPYTAGLMAARTRVHVDVERLQTIPGQPIAAFDQPGGCAFHTRCSFATPRCSEQIPPARTELNGTVACWRSEEIADALRLDGTERSRA